MPKQIIQILTRDSGSTTRSHGTKKAAQAAAPTQPSGLKSQPSAPSVEVLDADEPRKVHADALQSIGKSITDEQIADALARADEAAHGYLTQCLLAGATLCAAKAATPHGDWEKRFQKVCKLGKSETRFRFEITSRMARNYMQLWRHFVADLDAGEVISFADQQHADEIQDALIALPHSESVLAQSRITPAIHAWIGEEGSIRGLLDRIGRAEREAEREEDDANKVGPGHPQYQAPVPPNIQTTFMDTLFDSRDGIVTRLRCTIESDVYTTLPKSEWQRLFGELEPLYRLTKERAGF